MTILDVIKKCKIEISFNTNAIFRFQIMTGMTMTGMTMTGIIGTTGKHFLIF